VLEHVYTAVSRCLQFAWQRSKTAGGTLRTWTSEGPSVPTCAAALPMALLLAQACPQNMQSQLS